MRRGRGGRGQAGGRSKSSVCVWVRMRINVEVSRHGIVWKGNRNLGGVGRGRRQCLLWIAVDIISYPKWAFPCTSKKIKELGWVRNAQCGKLNERECRGLEGDNNKNSAATQRVFAFILEAKYLIRSYNSFTMYPMFRCYLYFYLPKSR